ncbi:uncharacterized protein BDW70DRAFT_164659 [Aspergillus foveolatus]|uniref:uncharacterized protein n=1 Tax=Aspergillus foveolatus TaxID=210207 RepID=UPI003CCE4D0C
MSAANPIQEKLERVRRLQRGMALAYAGLGAWCLLHPASAMRLSFNAEHVTTDRASLLLMQCFGAQATTCGMLLGVANMSRTSFTVFSLAMVPYIVFNVWFGIGPGRGVFTHMLWLDFIGNVFFCLGSLYCAILLREVPGDTGVAGRHRVD